MRDHGELYRKVEYVIRECEDPTVNWLARRDRDYNSISDYIALTAQGRIVYPLSHLVGRFFGNYYVKWIMGALIAWIFVHWFVIAHPA